LRRAELAAGDGNPVEALAAHGAEQILAGGGHGRGLSCGASSAGEVRLVSTVPPSVVKFRRILFPSISIIVCRYHMNRAYSRLQRVVAREGDGYTARRDYTYFRNRLRELGHFKTRVYRPAAGSASDSAYAGLWQEIHREFGDYPHFQTVRTRTKDGTYTQTLLVWDVSDRIPAWDRVFREYYGSLGIPLETIIMQEEVGARPVEARSLR
jgi:hypothetical protein